ncbi:MAG TPA: type III pantothenate kinase [Kofleriaceae bacterium]|nr:type III pantothenate kinase [Kofleriaceae bacterium]
MGALIAIDIGNTNTVLGIYRDDELLCHFRVETRLGRTADEHAVLLRELYALVDVAWPGGEGGIVSSVVPPAVEAIKDLFAHHLRVPLRVVGPGIKTGMPILYDNPREVGADRIVNAVAAYERFHDAVIVVDFGTATTWDVVTVKGEYLGGVIAPGIHISAEALYQHAAKLPRVEMIAPDHVVGKNTIASMQSGLIFGYAGMVDAVIDRIREQVGECRTIATGGLAPLIAGESKRLEATDELLTLRGLKVLADRNR